MTSYASPSDTANGHLGAVYAEPKDKRGVFIPEFPIALVEDSIIRRSDRSWGNHEGNHCPYGMWGDNFDPDNELPWCDDGEGCRVLGYAWDMKQGDEFPELVVVYRDGEWLVDDGYHRLGAWVLLGRTHVPALVFSDDGPNDPAIRALEPSS
jgi:hypothetical protein